MNCHKMCDKTWFNSALEITAAQTGKWCFAYGVNNQIKIFLQSKRLEMLDLKKENKPFCNWWPYNNWIAPHYASRPIYRIDNMDPTRLLRFDSPLWWTSVQWSWASVANKINYKIYFILTSSQCYCNFFRLHCNRTREMWVNRRK